MNLPLLVLAISFICSLHASGVRALYMILSFYYGFLPQVVCPQKGEDIEAMGPDSGIPQGISLASMLIYLPGTASGINSLTQERQNFGLKWITSGFCCSSSFSVVGR
jgi:hypothetical protein